MTQINLNNITVKAKGYIKENWGSPFIAVFIALLLTVAFSLSLDFSSLSDAIAVYAFCFLVVGTILQFVCSVKYKELDGGKENN